jgi:anti-sigma28 factor (negative regulator of flagellin synthesis)
MKIPNWFLTSTLAAAIAFTSLSLIASADEGTTPADVDQPMQQHMEEMKAAVESGDYNAFAEVAPEQLLEVINADNFGRFIEMHNHLQSAQTIAEELGLPQGRMGAGMHKLGKGEMKGELMQNREEIRAAIEAGDYQAWYELQTQNNRNPKILEYVNEGNFAKFAELHKAIQNRDFETAKDLKVELDLPDRPEGEPTGMGRGRGFMKNTNE